MVFLWLRGGEGGEEGEGEEEESSVESQVWVARSFWGSRRDSVRRVSDMKSGGKSWVFSLGEGRGVEVSFGF